MTCARCKHCPGLRMAGFRNFQQTSCITHKVFIAVEVCTPAMPFHTRLGGARPRVPKRSATISLHFFSGGVFYARSRSRSVFLISVGGGYDSFQGLDTFCLMKLFDLLNGVLLHLHREMALELFTRK